MAVDPADKLHHIQAKAKAKETWDAFIRSRPNHPELKNANQLHSFEEFDTFIKNTLHENVNTWELWQGVAPLHTDTPVPHEDAHDTHDREETHTPSHNSHHASFLQELNQGAVPGVAALLRKPKFMEEDPQFWNLMHKEEKAWKKVNKKPGWRATKEEKLAYEEKFTDFYYGKLDADSNTLEGKSLQQRAKEKLFAKYQNGSEKDRAKLKRFEGNENKTTQQVGWFRKKEVPIKFDSDHQVWHVKNDITQEAAARYQALKKRGLKGSELDQSYKAVMKRLEEKRWKEFAQQHPEKAAHFAKEDYKIKQFKNKKRQHQEEEKQKTFDAFRRAHEQVLTEKEQSAIVDRGKVHTEKNALTPEQAAQRLQALSHPTTPVQPTSPLILPQKPTPTSPPPATPTPPSSPTAKPTPSPAAQQASQKRIAMLIAILKRYFRPSPPTPPSTPPPQPKTELVSQTVTSANRMSNIYNTGKNLYNAGRAIYRGTQTLTSGSSAAGASGAAGATGTGAAATGAGSAAATSATAASTAAAGAAGTAGAATAGAAGAGGATIAAGGAAAAGAGAAVAGGGAAAGGAAVGTGAAVAGGISIGGIALIIILLLLLFIFILYMIFAILGAISSQNNKNTIPGLTIRLSGPFQVANSENIAYRIDATYTGTADITLSDPLPAETTFVNASGNYQLSFRGANANTTVFWKLADNTPTDSAGTKSYMFTLTIHPEKNDTLIKNKVYANASGIPGGGGTTLPPNANAGDFESLMRGQGRNIGVLGDEHTFTSTVMANEPRIVRYESLIRQAYKAAVERNVNPLVIIAMWGEESGYDTSGELFAMGCGVYIGKPKDFMSQLSCQVNTWDNRMKEYDRKAAESGIPVNLPSEIGNTCNYDDAFLYAAERYGPVCVKNDNNAHFKANFYKFYKKLSGQ